MWKAKEHLRFAREVKQEPARRKTRAHTFGSFNCEDRSTVLGVQDSRVANGKQLQEVRPAASMPDFFFFFFGLIIKQRLESFASMYPISYCQALCLSLM